MIFITFGKNFSKGKLTPEKAKRIERLREIHFERHDNIKRDFDATAEARALESSINKATAQLGKMLEDLSSIPNQRRRLKSLFLKKHSKKIRYLKELRNFAEKKGASHNFLRYLDEMASKEKFSLENAIRFL